MFKQLSFRSVKVYSISVEIGEYSKLMIDKMESNMSNPVKKLEKKDWRTHQKDKGEV